MDSMKIIGYGSEATVYLDDNQAIKIFNDNESEEISKALLPHKYQRIVTPQELIYNDDLEYLGYSMPYIESTDDIHKIKRNDLLESLKILKQDIIALSHDGILAHDLIPKNSILNNGNIYLIDTSLYKIASCDLETLTSININTLNRYLISLIHESTKSLDAIKNLKKLKLDYYKTVYDYMMETETIEEFANRISK